MFVITVDFEIKSEFVNEFRNRVLKQAKDSLNNEEKCLHSMYVLMKKYKQSLSL